MIEFFKWMTSGFWAFVGGLILIKITLNFIKFVFFYNRYREQNKFRKEESNKIVERLSYNDEE